MTIVSHTTKAGNLFDIANSQLKSRFHSKTHPQDASTQMKISTKKTTPGAVDSVVTRADVTMPDALVAAAVTASDVVASSVTGADVVTITDIVAP